MTKNNFIYFIKLIATVGAVVINNLQGTQEDLKALLLDLFYLRNDLKAFTIKNNVLYVATY